MALARTGIPPNFMQGPEASEQESLTRASLEGVRGLTLSWSHGVRWGQGPRGDGPGLERSRPMVRRTLEGSVSLSNERAREVSSLAVTRQPPRQTCLWGFRMTEAEGGEPSGSRKSCPCSCTVGRCLRTEASAVRAASSRALTTGSTPSFPSMWNPASSPPAHGGRQGPGTQNRGAQAPGEPRDRRTLWCYGRDLTRGLASATAVT